MASFLGNLDANFGTKSFDPERSVSDVDLAKVKAAICSTPSSFGLQPYTIIDVRESTIRAALRGAARDQTQVTDAPHLFVFCARTDLKQRVDEYVAEALAQGVATNDSLTLYAKKVSSITKGYDAERALTWTTKQAYITLGFALAACAELGIDACPIEGISEKLIANILALPETHVPVFLLAFGYRKEDSPYKRFRFSENNLFSRR